MDLMLTMPITLITSYCIKFIMLIKGLHTNLAFLRFGDYPYLDTIEGMCHKIDPLLLEV